MVRRIRKESKPTIAVSGWFALIGFAFIFKLLPFVLAGLIIYYIAKKFQKPPKAAVAESEVMVYNFDDYDPETITPMTPIEVAEPAKPTVPINIIEDAVSVLVNLRTNKGMAKEAVALAVENGAMTIEEIIKQSLCSLNSR